MMRKPAGRRASRPRTKKSGTSLVGKALGGYLKATDKVANAVGKKLPKAKPVKRTGRRKVARRPR